MTDQRRRKADQKPWWHAHAGWITALVLALFNLWQSRTESATRVTTLSEVIPAWRDKELAAMRNTFERDIDQLDRRVTAQENRRCAP